MIIDTDKIKKLVCAPSMSATQLEKWTGSVASPFVT